MIWAGSWAPVASVTESMAIGSQYLPLLAKVANALAMVSGAVWVDPMRLPRVVIGTWGLGLSALGSPPWMPTASTTFWIPQRSTWAAVANVMVLMEFARPSRTDMYL